MSDGTEAVALDVAFTSLPRPRRIILRLSDGLTPIPKLAREYHISEQRIRSIAKAAEKRNELERIGTFRPVTYRGGPNLYRNGFMGHEGDGHESPVANGKETATLPVRFHALQAKVAVTDLTGADLNGWSTWDTKRGKMASTTLKGCHLKVQLRGTEHPILVVDMPALSVDVPYADGNGLEMCISNAVAMVKERVASNVHVASQTCREKYGIVTKGPATWYRPPEIAIERFPGLPKNARYRIAYVWVDSSVGNTEAETDSLPTLHELMSIANRIHFGLSTLATFDEMPMSEPLSSAKAQ